MTEREFDETTLWTPANIVTLVRILLVPVFVVAIISPWPTYIPDWHNAELCKPWVAALIFAFYRALTRWMDIWREAGER